MQSERGVINYDEAIVYKQAGPAFTAKTTICRLDSDKRWRAGRKGEGGGLMGHFQIGLPHMGRSEMLVRQWTNLLPKRIRPKLYAIIIGIMDRGYLKLLFKGYMGDLLIGFVGSRWQHKKKLTTTIKSNPTK